MKGRLLFNKKEVPTDKSDSSFHLFSWETWWLKNGYLQCTKDSDYKIPDIKAISNGLESDRYLGPKILKLIPDELKELKSLVFFKKKVKGLNFENCPCKLCENYIHGVGYIN